MRKLILCVLCASGINGCATFEPASGVPLKSRAYFVRHSGSLSTEMWVCDASSGRPVCYEAGAAPRTAENAN